MEIDGYTNYLIYEDGRVFNKETNKFKKASIFSQTGYLEVSLYKNTKRKHFLIHRLIGQYYIPNPHNYPFIDHIDRNRLNNDISNLRWVDASTNSQNTPIQKNNTSGHKGLCIHKNPNTILWSYEKSFRGKRYRKTFKSKTDALCYKYIILLKIKARNKLIFK